MVDISPAIIALGGNTLVEPGEEPSDETQLQRTKETLKKLKPLIKSNPTVITHGNGPQAGNLLIQQEEAKEEVPELPLDTCVAMTQGQIGYYIEKSTDSKTVSLVTQVEVDADDPAFQNPKKPVGPRYEEKPDKDWEMTKQDGKWRRVVPSPEPRKIIEIKQIKHLLDKGFNAVACGGGGVPVKKTDHEYEGIEAVIDKDKVSALLGKQLNASKLYMITDVPYVYRDYGTENQEKIEKMHISKARKLLKEDEFGEGSMKPKIEAATRFLSSGGDKVIITNIDNADKILEDKGTVIKK